MGKNEEKLNYSKLFISLKIAEDVFLMYSDQ
jgi:hypothetical protein